MSTKPAHLTLFLFIQKIGLDAAASVAAAGNPGDDFFNDFLQLTMQAKDER
jgi:hypothetical protein